MHLAAGVSEEFTKKMEEWENRKKKSTGKGMSYLMSLAELVFLSDSTVKSQSNACFPLFMITTTQNVTRRFSMEFEK